MGRPTKAAHRSLFRGPGPLRRPRGRRAPTPDLERGAGPRGAARGARGHLAPLPAAPVRPPPARPPRRVAAPKFGTREERCGRCSFIAILKHKVCESLRAPGWGGRDTASPPQERPPCRRRRRPKLFLRSPRAAGTRRTARRASRGRGQSRAGAERPSLFRTSPTIPTTLPLRGGCAGPRVPAPCTPRSAGRLSAAPGSVRGGARSGAGRCGGAVAPRCHCPGGCQSGGERPGIGAGLVTQLLCAHIQG